MSVSPRGARMRWGRPWRVGLLAAVLTMGGAAVAGLERVREGPGLPAGEEALPGLEGPVDVLWDSTGVPHVWAASVADAFRVQGWLHGTHRLWQVETFRRVATGRLSEVFGEATLETDRFLRTLGMHRAAEASLASTDAATRAQVEAYVEGLNAAVRGWRGPLPPEFLVLRARPDTFGVADALALEKVMAWDLAEYELSLDLTAARAGLDGVGWEEVRPRVPDDGLTILPDGDPAAARETAPGAEPSAPAPWVDPRLVAGARVPAAGLGLVSAPSMVRASNAWVVGGERSASGRPLLANDMHLGLDAPTLWYLVGLHAPGLDVVGMSLPGAPGVVAGHNAAVAWGFTNAALDDTDLFVERVDPADTTRYLAPGGSLPFEVRTELIRVRGWTGPDTLRVRSTRHGPVITRVEARAGGDLLALRWVALEPSSTFRAVLAMNRARSADELEEALRDFTDPHQNVVYADTSGAWGYRMAGRIPRRPDTVPPLLPVPGWSGEHDWQGYLAFEEHPAARAPAQGFVATANNRQTRAPVSRRIADASWSRPYRAERITELLAARADHDVASMQAIQMDVESTFVRRHLATAVSAFRDAGLDGAAGLLAGWDGRATLDAPAATLFHAWVEALRGVLARRLWGPDGGYYPRDAVERTLDLGGAGADVLREAAGAVADAEDPPAWGEAHTLELDHPLAAVPVVGGVLGFGRRGIPREGGPNTVNQSSHHGAGPPFTVTAGPSQRHVVDLADPGGSGGFVLPGGQSGYPGDPHHMDQLELWRRGGLVPLPLSRADVERRSVRTLRLVPADPRGG